MQYKKKNILTEKRVQVKSTPRPEKDENTEKKYNFYKI